MSSKASEALAKLTNVPRMNRQSWNTIVHQLDQMVRPLKMLTDSQRMQYEWEIRFGYLNNNGHFQAGITPEQFKRRAETIEDAAQINGKGVAMQTWSKGDVRYRVQADQGQWIQKTKLAVMTLTSEQLPYGTAVRVALSQEVPFQPPDSWFDPATRQCLAKFNRVTSAVRWRRVHTPWIYEWTEIQPQQHHHNPQGLLEQQPSPGNLNNPHVPLEHHFEIEANLQSEHLDSLPVQTLWRVVQTLPCLYSNMKLDVPLQMRII